MILGTPGFLSLEVSATERMEELGVLVEEDQDPLGRALAVPPDNNPTTKHLLPSLIQHSNHLPYLLLWN